MRRQLVTQPRGVQILPDSIKSFYEAVREAEYIVASRKPDLIIAPLRGAEPIIESMRVIAELEGRKLPEVAYVETGTLDSRQDGKPLRPLFPKKKVELVRARLSQYIEKSDGHLKVCLIDEVISGGSIVKNYDYVNGALRLFYPNVEFELSAIAICEGGIIKCGRFEQLRGMRRITPLFVDDLFTIDRTRFLTPLVRRGDEVRQEGEYPRNSKPMLYAELERLHRGLQK